MLTKFRRSGQGGKKVAGEVVKGVGCSAERDVGGNANMFALFSDFDDDYTSRPPTPATTLRVPHPYEQTNICSPSPTSAARRDRFCLLLLPPESPVL